MSGPAVLVVHNRYQERGGEDAVFEAEMALLEAHGHAVRRLVFDNRDLPVQPSPRQSLAIAFDTVWSRRARARIRDAIAAFHPQVVHFHNTFPLVSPAVYPVCREAGAAVVQTLHNYRLICPGALLYRDGHPCEDCVGRALPLAGLGHACYRGSRVQTGVVAAMLVAHRLRGTWRSDVDRYVAPSAFLKRKLIEGGLPEERIVVKPNFVDPDPGAKQEPGGYVLFAGRLTETKGIETLLAAYAQRAELPPLHAAGGGALASRVAAAAAADPRITYRGHLDREGVLAEMAGACCLVFPSVWYENFPVTIAEAFARGLPVAGARIGAIADLIDDGRTGLLFRPGDPADLGDKLAWAVAHPGALAQMSLAARREYVSKYTGERNYAQLITIYAQALGGAADRPGVK